MSRLQGSDVPQNAHWVNWKQAWGLFSSLNNTSPDSGVLILWVFNQLQQWQRRAVMKAAEKPVTHMSLWGYSLVLWSALEMTSLPVFQGECHIIQLSNLYRQKPFLVLKNLPLCEIYSQSMTMESYHDEKRQRQMMAWHTRSLFFDF